MKKRCSFFLFTFSTAFFLPPLCIQSGWGGAVVTAQKKHTQMAQNTQEQQLWNAWCPWLYKNVTVLQMEGETVSLDAEIATDTHPDALRVLTATNSWPARSTGKEQQNVSSTLMLSIGAPPLKAPVREFVDTGYAAPEYVARVCQNRPVLRARCLRHEKNIAVVKLTDRVALADLKKGAPFTGSAPLPSRRAENIGVKSAALACQPGGTLAVYADFVHPPHNDGGLQGLAVWDVRHNETAGPRTTTILQVDGKIEDVCFPNGAHSHDTVWACSADGYLRCVDLRSGTQVSAASAVKRECIAPHSMSLESVSSSASGDLVVTGGSAGMVVWDCRMTGRGHLLAFDHGAQKVTHTACHPTDDALIVSATADGRVWVWDLSLHGPASDQDLPTELLFMHSGHAPAGVTDVMWHPSRPQTIVSADKHAFLHVYSPLVLHEEVEK